MDLCTESALFRAAVPSGASTGIYEATTLKICFFFVWLVKVEPMLRLHVPVLTNVERCERLETSTWFEVPTEIFGTERHWSCAMVTSNGSWGRVCWRWERRESRGDFVGFLQVLPSCQGIVTIRYLHHSLSQQCKKCIFSDPHTVDLEILNTSSEIRKDDKDIGQQLPKLDAK